MNLILTGQDAKVLPRKAGWEIRYRFDDLLSLPSGERIARSRLMKMHPGAESALAALVKKEMATVIDCEVSRLATDGTMAEPAPLSPAQQRAHDDIHSRWATHDVVFRHYMHGVERASNASLQDRIAAANSRPVEIRLPDAPDAETLACANRRAIATITDGARILVDDPGDYRKKTLLRGDSIESCNDKKIVIDDLMRKHSCDVLIDGNILRTPEDYAASAETVGKMCCGPEYSLVERKFIRARRPRTPPFRRCLVSFGGSDPQHCLRSFVRTMASDARFRRFRFEIVSGPMNGDHAAVLRTSVSNAR